MRKNETDGGAIKRFVRVLLSTEFIYQSARVMILQSVPADDLSRTIIHSHAIRRK
jgi:hypothetical protein